MNILDLDRITNPLRLVQGHHEEGSGIGCAMDCLSFITGEAKITDFPTCSARPLARMVQFANDMMAEYNLPPFQREAFAVKYLSPEDSILALDLAWSTVGTAVTDDTTLAVWGSRALSNAQAIVQHVDPLPEHAWELLMLAREYAFRGDYVNMARGAVNAVFIATDIDVMVHYVRDAIALWKELNDVVTPQVDPVVVNEAIDRMVSV